LGRSYGPEGFSLYIASMADRMLGAVLMVAGLIVLIASRGVHAVGYWVGAAGIVMTAFAFARLVQARRAGREFRKANKPSDPGT
jgi:hypothetical protein